MRSDQRLRSYVRSTITLALQTNGGQDRPGMLMRRTRALIGIVAARGHLPSDYPLAVTSSQCARVKIQPLHSIYSTRCH
jgi:hypothetical protein